MTSNDPKDAAKDIGDRATTASNRTVDMIKDVADQGGERMRDFAARAGETASDIFDKANDRVRRATEGLPDSASEALDAGRRVYDHGSRTVGRQVSKQPIEALLLAGAIGFLVGWATNRS